MTNSPVAIYSTPTCHFCGMTKEFFKEHNVEYVEHNVAADVEKRKEMIEKSGQMGVPVITIGENVIVGYDEEELRRLLNL
jgi:glutaredoxin 3